MTTVLLTDPQNGQLCDASVIAANNASLAGVLNGNLDNGNISPAAGILPAKIAGYPNDGTKVLRGDGTWNAVTSAIYRKATPKVVNTSVAATDLLNGEISIAANTMGVTGMLRLTLWGDFLQNSGVAASPPRFQLLLGGTTLIDTGLPPATVNATAVRGAWRADVIIAAANATNAQTISWQHHLTTGGITYTGGVAIVAFTTGTGTYSQLPSRADTSSTSGGQWQAIGYGTGTKDMTALQALAVNVINGSANANYETRLAGALVEIL